MNCMVVDDKLNLVDISKNMLQGIRGIGEVHSFTSPTNALVYVGNNKDIDIAFLDIEMSEMSGIDLARKLKKLNPDICIVFVTCHSDYALEAFGIHASGYIVKPITQDKLENEIYNIFNQAEYFSEKRIFAYTFGTFDLFVDKQLVRFSSAKAKELLAYLIDRRGSSVTGEQAIAILWEDRPYDAKTRSLYRMTLSALRKTLKDAGALEILHDNRNCKSINTDLISCDYYDFMTGDDLAVHQYMGEYMQQYSWGNTTAAMLDLEKEIFM